MRKGLFLLIGVSLFFLTGCSVGFSEQTLKCNKTSYDYTLGNYNDEIEYVFKGTKVVSEKIKYTYNLSRFSANDQKVFVDAMREQCLKVVESGITANFYQNGSSGILEMAINYDEFDGYFNYLNEDYSEYKKGIYSIEKTQDNLKNSGYTCSISK